MFDHTQFREVVVRPTLSTIGLYSMAAEDLIVGTCAAESRLGTYIKQVGTGPALGVMQVEPATHDDCWASWLRFRSNEQELMRQMVAPCWWSSEHNRPRAIAMVYSLDYSVAIARIVYRRAKPPLPKSGDWQAMAAYWVQFYNRGGAGTEAHFLDACETCGVIR